MDFDGCRLGGEEFLSPLPVEWERVLRIGVRAALLFPVGLMSEMASSLSTPIPSKSFLHKDSTLPSPLTLGPIPKPTRMGLCEVISMSSRSSSSKSSTSQSRRGSAPARALPLLRGFRRWCREESETLPVDVSNDNSPVDEDSEARGPDVKGLRSGAPKFPTRSSVAIVGILILSEDRESAVWSFLKNTWRRLRKNRVTRMVRNL